MGHDDWDEIHHNYRDQVMSVYHNDQQGRVLEWIDQLSVFDNSDAVDVGCGRGYYTQYLAKRFQEVHACDYSETGLAAAKKRCRKFENVTFSNLNVVDGIPDFEPQKLVICVNVLLMPKMNDRLRAWRTVTNQVKSGGKILLVLPALESIVMENWNGTEQSLLDGNSCEDTQKQMFPAASLAEDLFNGVYLLDGVRTKHYLKEEITALLDTHEFELQKIEKLKYESNTWDWLVIAQRRDAA